MKKQTQTVWTDESGDDLIVRRSDNEWRIVPCTVTVEKMQQLRNALQDAISDALKDRQKISGA